MRVKVNMKYIVECLKINYKLWKWWYSIISSNNYGNIGCWRNNMKMLCKYEWIFL